MKISHLFTAVINIALLSFFIVSCTKDLPNEETGRKSDYPVEWNTVLDASRVQMNSDGSGKFENGDVIVVYTRDVTSGNEKHYTLHFDNGRWLPEVYWKELGDNVVFTAWYLASSGLLDYDNQVPGNYIHSISENLQGGGYEDSDLMWAQAAVKVGESVNLYFKHALSRLNLVLYSNDGSYTDEQLQKAEVRIYTSCSVPFNLADGSMLKSYDYRWIVPERKDNNLRTALLCPQETRTLGSEGWIRINIDGSEKMVELPEAMDGKPFERLEPGKQITYRLNLKRGTSADEFAGTTRWVYGINDSNPGEWNYDKTQLSWIENCGWFDCNKTNPSGTSYGEDGLMCWAASVSNLIHWWLRQNAETEAVRSYSGPAAIPSDMLHSGIFQLFKNNFPNKGEYPLKAINWFFNGVFHRNMYNTDVVDSRAGFFSSQLGINSLGAEYMGQDMARDRFNSIIKQALTSRKGILFVVNMGRWATHAVTLWGVKFNDEGFIETLYMVDNNDGRSDMRGTIRTMKVEYLPYSASNQALYPYVPNSLGDFTIRIESICTLSLGENWIK